MLTVAGLFRLNFSFGQNKHRLFPVSRTVERTRPEDNLVLQQRLSELVLRREGCVEPESDALEPAVAGDGDKTSFRNFEERFGFNLQSFARFVQLLTAVGLQFH